MSRATQQLRSRADHLLEPSLLSPEKRTSLPQQALSRLVSRRRVSPDERRTSMYYTISVQSRAVLYPTRPPPRPDRGWKNEGRGRRVGGEGWAFPLAWVPALAHTTRSHSLSLPLSLPPHSPRFSFARAPASARPSGGPTPYSMYLPSTFYRSDLWIPSAQVSTRHTPGCRTAPSSAPQGTRTSSPVHSLHTSWRTAGPPSFAA